MAHMEAQEPAIEKYVYISLDEANGFIERLFDGSVPAVSYEALAIRGVVSRLVGNLEITVTGHETQYVVSIKKREHYNNV